MLTSRRALLGALAALPVVAGPARAATAREIMWEDLIPPGVPYSEIVGEGEVDEVADTWLPTFDENGMKFNEALDGTKIRMPGYMLPLETSGTGVTEFILTPYVGACIHVPPPPPNQLVMAVARKPWQSESMWDAIWVEGVMRVDPISTNLAEIGYAIDVEFIELYEWT